MLLIGLANGIFICFICKYGLFCVVVIPVLFFFFPQVTHKKDDEHVLASVANQKCVPFCVKLQIETHGRWSAHA